MKTYWLSTHLGYACRHSGACCSSGWPIPVERDLVARVERAIATGCTTPAPASWLSAAAADAPTEVAGVLAVQPFGACVFHRPTDTAGGCAIHALRPASCEHFPYISVIDPRGAHVTLSHYCPTAAELLFLDQEAVGVVEGPPVFPGGRIPEGLDAREALPPADDQESRPGGAAGTVGSGAIAPSVGAETRGVRRPRLMDWDAVTRWEQGLVRDLASDARVPGVPDLSLFAHARASVPPHLSWPDAPDDVEAVWAGQVAPAWASWTHVVGRYLASRAHASWALHLGRGLGDVARAVDTARAVLQVEAVRRCRHPRAVLDRGRLKAAIRQSDLLLAHYADPCRLFGDAA